ncbi:hypothetical protein ASC58_13650 [Phycicoccus sp. Root101]|nr:hypothetical protein ASC58_13650 [Phycicoccus sp. Root101]
MFDLTAHSPRELLALYSQILTELIRRRIIWSRNAPAGDYAELLVAEAFDGGIARASEKSWDVRVHDRLLQVKCRVTDASAKKSQTYSPFRSFEFDACVFVLLDSVTYEVVSAIEVDRQVVEESSSLSAWVAGRRVTVKQVLSLQEKIDVTERLRKAQADIDDRGRRAIRDGESTA